ncbi:MAG: hypothetical protein R2877_00895 [Bdellovibrionota bacterium]
MMFLVNLWLDGGNQKVLRLLNFFRHGHEFVSFHVNRHVPEADIQTPALAGLNLKILAGLLGFSEHERSLSNM